MAKIYCDNCGDAVDGLEYCTNCGDKVLVASPEAVSAAVAEKSRWQVIKDAIKSYFKNYSVFEGRSTRDEFGYPWLMMILINRLTSIGSSSGDEITTGDLIVLAIQFAIWAAVLVPTLAVMARRLHDTGRSAKNLWFFALPIVGWILLLVWCLGKSEPRNNKYGPYTA
jgi:uncharacterized membrane protein YhaH (DUF805 family)